jgi:anti-sigma regulatory factor (Ser/Thr protein kinase)
MGRLRTSQLPAQAVELHQWLLADADELRPLRADLHKALAGHRLAEDGTGPIVLVATELASNALRHGLPPAMVRLLKSDDQFFLEVADRDLASVPKLAEAHPSVGGGRGLHIARSLSVEVCWYATEQFKHVWASFPDPAASASRTD